MKLPAPHSRIPGRVFRAEGPLGPSDGLLRIGTRGSTLAVTQTRTVADRIARETGMDVALIIVTTHGDRSTAPSPSSAARASSSARCAMRCSPASATSRSTRSRTSPPVPVRAFRSARFHPEPTRGTASARATG